MREARQGAEISEIANHITAWEMRASVFSTLHCVAAEDAQVVLDRSNEIDLAGGYEAWEGLLGTAHAISGLHCLGIGSGEHVDMRTEVEQHPD